MEKQLDLLSKPIVGELRPSWSSLRSDGAPSQRHAHSAVVWKDSLFIFGGYDSGNHLGDFYVYRFDSGKWSEVKSHGRAPSARHSHTAALFGSSMYIFGGIGPKGVLLNDVYEFDFERFSWHEVTVSGLDSPAGRWGHSAVIAEQSMFIYAGLTAKGYVDDLWEFHFNSRSWSKVNTSGEIPSPRHFHASVVANGCMFVFGGFGHKNMDDLNIFDFSMNRWRDLKPGGGTPPAPRRGHSMTFVEPGLLVVFGGRAHTNLSDTYTYNIESNTWSLIDCTGQLPMPRHFHSASSYKSKMFVFGGIAGKLGSLSDLCRLTLGSLSESGSGPTSPTQARDQPSLSPTSSHRLSDEQSTIFVDGASDSLSGRASESFPSTSSPSLPRVSLSASTGKIRLKCQFVDEMRVIPVSKTIDLVELKQLIGETGALDPASFVLQYKDEEGDLITIRSSNELHEAFDSCEEEKQKFLRISVHLTGSGARRGSTGAAGPARSSIDRSGEIESPHQTKPRSRPSLSRPTSTNAAAPQETGPAKQQMPVKYKLGSMLGRGAFGAVFMGLDEETGQLFAVKKIQIDASQNNAQHQLDRLQNEIRLLSKVQHKNIVQYLGSTIDQSTHQLLIFLEYVAGGSLAGMIQKFGPFKERVVRGYCQQLLAGLEALHQRGIVHRDIKGANILVDSTGNIKLSDFGAATSIATVTLNQSQIVEMGESHLKTFAGTPYWMAPEVIRQNSYGRKCDIWAIGCTLLELVTGKPPWSHLNPVTALFQIGSDDEPPPQPPSFLSAKCRDFISRCLTRDVEQRPTVSELMVHPWILDDVESDEFDDEQEGFGGDPVESGDATGSSSSGSVDFNTGSFAMNPTIGSNGVLGRPRDAAFRSN